MKDASVYIIPELYRILSAAGLGVPVYNIEQFPGDEDTLMVRIASTFDIGGRTKDRFTQELHINLDVVERMKGDMLSEKRVSELANKVMSAILPSDVASSESAFGQHEDFYLCDISYVGSTPLRDRDHVGVIFIKQLEFKFNVVIK